MNFLINTFTQHQKNNKMDFYRIFPNEKLILIFYVDIRNLTEKDGNSRLYDLSTYLRRINEDNENITFYVVGIKGESRIDCINPKMVSSEEYGKIEKILNTYQEKVNEFIGLGNANEELDQEDEGGEENNLENLLKDL
jgi:hypothetical protein